MIYSEKYKFICMCRAKTGSTSMIQLLEEQFEAKIFMNWPSKTICKNKSDRDSRHVCLLPEQLADKGYFIFSLVRNPYAMEVSRFNYFADSSDWANIEEKYRWPKDISFSEYLRNYARRFDSTLSSQYLNFKHGAPEGSATYVPDQIIHLENLKSEFMTLPFVDKDVEFPTRNVQVHKASSLYTSVEDVDRVYEMRKEDFINFEYSRKLPWKLWTAKI